MKRRATLLAGDVFDGDWRDANTGFPLLQEGAVAPATPDAACPPPAATTTTSFTQTLLYRLPDFVHVFGPGTGAHTHAFERDGVAFTA
ncbi:MAG: hypothetical protein U0235_19670 [Polyangiaceae bacterium]